MKKNLTIRMKSTETAAEVFELFLLTKRADGVKPRTIETYKQHFHAILKHLDINQEIAEMTATDLKKMIVSMQDSGLAPNSTKSYSITLKAFLSWCNAEGITNLNMKKYKGEETIKETYTDEELKILHEKPNMKNCTFAEYRTWVVINFLINSGSRAATIRNIQNRDVDIKNGVIYARHTKNRKALVIPLCSQISAVLLEYMKIRGGKQADYLFPSENGEQLTESGFRCSIVKYNRNRGVEKTSTHLFRHTFAKKYLVDCGGNALMLKSSWDTQRLI